MIETTQSPTLAATVIHRVSGAIDRQQAMQGADEALQYMQRLSGEHGLLNLILDMRGVQFQDLPSQRIWSQGFARNPALQAYVGCVAIVGDDTPAFRAEQEMLAAARVRFFMALGDAEQWLAQAYC